MNDAVRTLITKNARKLERPKSRTLDRQNAQLSSFPNQPAFPVYVRWCCNISLLCVMIGLLIASLPEYIVTFMIVPFIVNCLYR